jgi:hypothetical protein
MAWKILKNGILVRGLMTKKSNKIFSVAVAIAIISSLAVLVYVNLQKQTETPIQDDTPERAAPSIFSLIYDINQRNFSLADLIALETYTAKGGYRTESGFIRGVGTYTGVNITTLIDTLQPIPPLYSIIVSSEDGETLMYNYTTIQGSVTIYDPDNASDPNPIGTGTMTMMLAYQYEGNWLDESSDGKLKIAFVDEQGSITKASLWWKKVTSIRIITE